MANIPMKDIQFPGLDDNYTFAQIDNTLTQTGEAADAKKTGDEISELKADFTQLDGKIAATQITNTASGAIASFSDGADDVPVKDLVVDIEPEQDLHGQANPYPAGGGKNKLPLTVNAIKSANTSNGSWSGNAFTTNGVTFTINTDSSGNVSGMNVNGTATANTFFYLANGYTFADGTYVLNGCPSTGDVDTYSQYIYTTTAYFDTGSGAEFTVSSQTANVIIRVMSGTTCNNIVFKPMVRLSSVSDTTFAPYENICPISGWTGANVARTGKNLLDDSIKTVSGSRLLIGATSNYENPTYLKAGTYSITVFGVNQTFGYLMKNKNSLKMIVVGTNHSSFTVDNDGYYRVDLYGDTAISGDVTGVILVPGSTYATTYTPYSGTTLNITFPTEAGTVYGGTLDVTTGVLTVDRAAKSIADLNFIYQSSYNRFYTSQLQGIVDASKAGTAICEVLKTATTGSNNINIAQSGNVFIEEVAWKSTAELNEAIGTALFCYPLAKPQTYQLDPVTIATLLGQNHIWCDCGNVSVDYRADTKLYIENLTAPSEDDMVANTNIPSDTYFMIGNTLYLSTTTIPAGDVINPGTNCTLMNLASALNALNS